jgi:hypothetical protein
VVSGYREGVTIAAAVRRAARADRPDVAQGVLEKATRDMIRRIAKGDRKTRSADLAKTA